MSQASQPTPKFSRPALIIAGITALSLGGFFLFTRPEPIATKAEETSAPKPVLTVRTAPAQLTAMTKRLEVTGSVAPWERLAVGAEVGGLRLERVLVQEGDRVKRGQVLAVLNADVLEAQKGQTQARIANAQALVRQQEAGLRQTQAVLAESEINYKRADDLYAAGAISGQDNLARVTALGTSRAQVDQSRQAIAVARSNVVEAQAQLRQIQAQLAQTQILAPDDGWVLERAAYIGNISSVGDPLFVLARQSRLELNAQVPETDLIQLAMGQSVRVYSDADAQLKATGTIRQIGPGIDATSRQALVKADLKANERLRPGMFVRAEVTLAQVQALTIPAQAVSVRNNEASVFILEGTKVRTRKVQLGQQDNQRVEVLSGLQEGQQVVAAGGGYLKDGDVVKITQLKS